MKKLLIVGLLSSFVSATAFAAACDGNGGAQTGGAATGGTANTEQCICNGGTAVKSTVNGGSGTVNSAPLFIKNGFDVMCSANTIVSYNEVSANSFGVGSGSKKGNQSFIGSTAGGAVTTSAKCTGTNDACTPANVTTATAAAATAAGS